MFGAGSNHTCSTTRFGFGLPFSRKSVEQKLKHKSPGQNQRMPSKKNPLSNGSSRALISDCEAFLLASQEMNLGRLVEPSQGWFQLVLKGVIPNTLGDSVRTGPTCWMEGFRFWTSFARKTKIIRADTRYAVESHMSLCRMFHRFV